MRPTIMSLLFVSVLVLSACGSAADETASAEATPAPTATTSPTVSAPTALPAPTAEGAVPTPVTGDALLQMLGLSAEPVASMGDPDAPVTIIEFADYGCRFCQRHHEQTFPQLEEQYISTGKLYYIYKDLPIISDQGQLAAQAAACAGEQNLFWEMHHELFLSSAKWNSSEEAAITSFRNSAVTIGADPDALEACVMNGDFAADVQEDLQRGLSLGLQSTPAFIINGKLLNGAYPFDTFVQILDGEISGNPVPTD